MTVLTRLLAVVALFTTLSLSGWSYPTLFGDTGLMLVPSADTMPYSFFQLGIDYAKIMDDAGDSINYPIRLTYGIAENIELFAVVAESQGNAVSGTNATGGGVKMSINDEHLYQTAPGIAVGARAVHYKRTAGDLDQIEAYLVASKILLAQGDVLGEGFFLRAHAVLSYTNYSGAHQGDFISGSAGLNYVTANGNSLVLEFIPEHENIRDATLSGALRIHLSPNFWLQVATTRPFGLGDDQSYSLGMMYQFGDKMVLPTGDQIFYY